MRDSEDLFSKVARKFRDISFFLANRKKFKKLGYRSLIVKPLRIQGAQYISIENNVKVNNQVWLLALKIDGIEPDLTLREGCHIGDFNHIVAVRKIVIEEQVLTANGVYISDNTHGYEDIRSAVMEQPVKFKSEVRIGKGSWIGENACILGATIGEHCVIGANAVVTRNIPDFSVAVGAPARVIRRYNIHTQSWENL